MLDTSASLALGQARLSLVFGCLAVARRVAMIVVIGSACLGLFSLGQPAWACLTRLPDVSPHSTGP